MADIKLHFKNESGKYECNYCKHDLAASTSTTRLRAHLIGAPNAGTKICPNVPDYVRILLGGINKRQKTATGYILPFPSNLPPVETEGMAEATTLVLPPDGSGANNYSGNQGRLQFLAQQHAMPLQYAAHLTLGETSEGQENHLRDDQIDDMILELESGANNHDIASFFPELNNDFGNQGGVLQYTMPTHPNESGRTTQLQHQFTTEYFPPNESCSNLEPEAFPPTDIVTQDLRNCCLTVEADQHGVGDAEMVQQEVQMVEGNPEGEGSAFRTKRLVGEAFVKNEGKIWSWLMDDQVLRVGLYGMGGVGKSTLMRHIQTRLKGQSSLKVFWVTVSQDFSIWKLQDLIAKQIDLKFLDKEDEVERAKKLAQEIQAKRKFVLILDDLWTYFDVDEVGIPVKAGGCKLVLTTRLLNVCQKMDCNEGNIIQVQALSREEAWILFTKELGNYSTEVEEQAKVVAIECDGLPLAIRVMARAMKGIREVHNWRNALEELRESKLSEGHKMREEVFPVLKFSYLHLIDPALRKCLLYCALFPEDRKIGRGELIEYMIVEGIIDAKKTRRAELDRGHTMLDTLVNASLLEGDTRDVWMHDLIRDMAIYELRERSNTLVEAGAQLKELPNLEEWTENLVCVSLMYNDIKKIPFRPTPRCPDLSTLLLRENYGLRRIAGSFLKQFQKLKVLDLSWCKTIKKLPRSVSDLVNLTALLLHECSTLSQVPSLAKLERLKKLDLSSCEMLKRMPEGVELLINLKHLDLSESGIERIGSEIIPKLSRLQVLNLGRIWKTSVPAKGKEVGRLEKLESLECSFDTKEWREYMKSREKSQQSLTHYFFVIGQLTSQEARLLTFFFDWRRSRGVVYIVGGISSNDYVALPLPTDIQALFIENDLNGSLWDSVLALKHTTQLHSLRLNSCDGIARLVNEPWDNLCGLSEVEKGTTTDTMATTPFLSNLKSIDIQYCHKLKNLYPARLLPNLQTIRVSNCRGMEELFGTDQEGEQVGLNLPQLIELELLRLPELRSIYNGAIICYSLQPFLSNLKSIEIEQCHKLKNLYPARLLPNLQNIRVWKCSGMEEIFGTDQEGEQVRLNLPQLIKLELYDLPELRSIYNGAITCHSLQQIEVVNCPKLERITFPLPQPSLRRIRADSKEWWDSVQWGSANDKIHLESLAGFSFFRYGQSLS